MQLGVQFAQIVIQIVKLALDKIQIAFYVVEIELILPIAIVLSNVIWDNAQYKAHALFAKEIDRIHPVVHVPKVIMMMELI